MLKNRYDYYNTTSPRLKQKIIIVIIVGNDNNGIFKIDKHA